MCDFIRKQKNNLNKFCTPKPQMHKESDICDFIRNLKNQFEQEYVTFVHVIFCLFSNEIMHIPVQIDFFILIGSHILYSLCM